ncbi:MAG: FAD-dependent oxidoreductase [Clostridia bacterium]|nr:FAD-dependent oxidoreductase [Clostridia bacterium]
MSIILTIDGKKIVAEEGMTILNVASQNGIKIPNLCYDGRVELYGACGLCTVEVEGNPKLLRACSTKVTDGMVVHTQTERVKVSRKVALELLLSDHTGDCVAPCSKACPAGTDCQGYVGLIANGEYKEAVKLIKEKLPLPASIGRICPHPCEKQCRRQYVDEPISIAFLKGFVGDMDLLGDTYIPEIEPDTNKKVAIIGGGPAGLTAAYFLRKKGHSVTIFEQMEKMGGMLRFGIPEYRLPKAVLDKEIKLIEDMGVQLKNNVNIGKDISFDQIKNDFDATLVAIGAWNSSKMRVVGEDLDGVWGGIDFLREVALGNAPEIGKNVAVCGGGNTAMDACRVAVRLGAENVYIIYRRTKDEMPADHQEILESEEEGVIYKYLTNPIEFIGENGKLNGVVLQKMMLGEPDESGRRSPVAIEGETEEIALDSVIMAIGQYPNLNGFETLEATRKNTICADESRFTTSVDGVFAVGDATNKGADIAIAAIGEAQKASVVIDRYLNGEFVGYKKPYFVEQNSKSIDYSKYEKVARAKMPHMAPVDRKTNFKEVNFGFTEEMAKKEANRCLECGCHDYFECKLISYANDYDVKPSRFAGEKHNRNQENANDLISRNADKCILCGLCVRVCEEVMGKSAIGLINRGFNTLVEPELSKPLKETDCIACGQCVALCPTGALREKSAFTKSVPVKENSKISICTNCSNLCDIDYRYIGSTVTRALPVDNGILCKGGRFGVLSEQKLTTDFDALLRSDTIVISGRTSTETAFVLKKYAEKNNIDIFTTAKETDANYYAISKLNIPQYNGNFENAIETSQYCENGIFFDKYGNKRLQNAIFKSESFAEYINNKLNTPYSDITAEAEKAVNATPTGKITNDEIINASKLFK